MMTLPATVEELNSQQSLKTPTFLLRKPDFEDIYVEKRIKREVSLPNGVENWHIENFDPYLNFDAVENAVITSFDVLASPEDRLVPENDLGDRSNSISSVASILDDKQITFHNFGVKTINTISMDSGSTCISSDHTYYGKSPTLHNSLDPGETYQDLDKFLQQVPELPPAEILSPSSFSPVPSTNSNDSFELTVLETYSSLNEPTTSTQQMIHSYDFPSTSSLSLKRSFETIADDDVFFIKQQKIETVDEFGVKKYHEIRRKNNIASKNCRKTRKEKQKEMETRVSELEEQRQKSKMQIQLLEGLIEKYKRVLLNAISQKR